VSAPALPRAVPPGANLPASEGALLRAMRRLVRHRLGSAGLAVSLLVAFAAAFAPWISPFDPAGIDYEAILSPPDAKYWLGTDEIGRDILSRIIQGAQVSVQVVFLAIAIAFVAGSLIGLASGYFGGVVDDVVMRIMDGLLAFPILVLALAIVAVLGPDLINAMIAIAIVNVPGFARLVRGQVLSIRELEFVQAARALGASDMRIMLRHVLPSVIGNVIVYASLRASTALITEASLSFLGLGAQPPTPTWGGMLATGMQYWDAWWMSVFPGLAIFLSALALNFLGDGLRDALDSRLQD
jgi:peptide/nickel transport system permease protein